MTFDKKELSSKLLLARGSTIGLYFDCVWRCWPQYFSETDKVLGVFALNTVGWLGSSAILLALLKSESGPFPREGTQSHFAAFTALQLALSFAALFQTQQRRWVEKLWLGAMALTALGGFYNAQAVFLGDVDAWLRFLCYMMFYNFTAIALHILPAVSKAARAQGLTLSNLSTGLVCFSFIPLGPQDIWFSGNRSISALFLAVFATVFILTAERSRKSWAEAGRREETWALAALTTLLVPAALTALLSSDLPAFLRFFAQTTSGPLDILRLGLGGLCMVSACLSQFWLFHHVTIQGLCSLTVLQAAVAGVLRWMSDGLAVDFMTKWNLAGALAVFLLASMFLRRPLLFLRQSHAAFPSSPPVLDPARVLKFRASD